MTVSAAEEALLLTGHQGQWLRNDAPLDSSRGGNASVAVAALAHDGIVVVDATPAGSDRVTSFASDGRAACTFATVCEEIVLGPAVPIGELVASLCLDIGEPADDDDDLAIVLDEATLAALHAVFGRGASDVTTSEARARLATSIEGSTPETLLRILAEQDLIEIDSEQIRAGALIRRVPALAAYVSGYRLDVYRIHLAIGGCHRTRRGLFRGPPGERFALLKGPGAGLVTIARMRTQDLSLALAAVIGGADGPDAPLAARPVTGTIDVPAGGPWTLTSLADLEGAPDAIADILDQPGWTARITIDAADGRRTLGMSGAEGLAIRWDSTNDGLVLMACGLANVPLCVAGDVLPEGTVSGAARPGASPEVVLRSLPHGCASDRRRALIALSVRRGDVIDTSSCIVLDRGSEGAWLIDLDDDAPEPTWTPRPATQEALAAWLRVRLVREPQVSSDA